MMKEKVLSAVNSQLADHHNNLMGLNEKNAELEQKNATLESSLSTLEEVRRSEEQSDELITQSQAAKTARARTFVQDASPPQPPQ